MYKSIPLLYKFILITLLIQTVVVTNAVKGLLVPYVLIIILFISTFVYKKRSKLQCKNYFLLVVFFLIYILLNNFSQLINLENDFNIVLDSSLLISKESSNHITFRKSFFTQSMYFMVCTLFYFSTLKYLKENKFEEIMKFIKIGLLLFIGYGYILYVGFFVTGGNIDFLSNRITGVDNSFGGEHLQQVFFAGHLIPRFQSLVGEPSMFAFSIVPFFIYYYYIQDKFMYLNLLVVLLLSTSGSAIVGLVGFFVIDLLIYRKTIKLFFILLGFIIVIIFINIDVILDFYNFFFSKINLEHISGITRFDNFNQTIDFFNSLTIFSQVFGIGFGYVRSTDGLSTILVNNGVVGLLIVASVYLYPLVTLKATNNYLKAIKVSNSIIIIMLITSVPEFYNLHIYFFLAILWFELIHQKKRIKTC